MTNANDLNAAQCPECAAYVTPANDVTCWQCGASFLGEHFWDFLLDG